MKLSRFLSPTMKDQPQEAEFIGHSLMIRAGMIRQTASGVFTLLPMGLRTLRKIEAIARAEIAAIGGTEMVTPLLSPIAPFGESRRASNGNPCPDSAFQTKDLTGRIFTTGASPVPIFLETARREIRSYRELPALFFRIGLRTKDEQKPRGGLIKAREFITLEAAGFYSDKESLSDGREAMRQAMDHIFARCEVTGKWAEAAPLGDCREFFVSCDIGEGLLFSCESCGYSAIKEAAFFRNPETAALKAQGKPAEPPASAIRKVHTPGKSSIESLCDFLNIPPSRLIKAMVFTTDGEPIMALVRGDRSLNPEKLRKALGARSLEMATADEISRFTGGPMGFSGPVGMKSEKIVADDEIRSINDAVVGANELDFHFAHVTPGADFIPGRYAQLRDAEPGDGCPHCEKPMNWEKGFSMGRISTVHIDEDEGKMVDVKGDKGRLHAMGCAIGISRIAGILAQSSNDKDGLIWPSAIAPFSVVVIPAILEDKAHRSIASNIYEQLLAKGVDAVFEDRERRPGFKFKDADLIGYPVRVVAGNKTVKEGLVEIKVRCEKEPRYVPTKEAVESVVAIFGKSSCVFSPFVI